MPSKPQDLQYLEIRSRQRQRKGAFSLRCLYSEMWISKRWSPQFTMFTITFYITTRASIYLIPGKVVTFPVKLRVKRVIIIG